MKTVLFISHEASRTGAPLLLLHFLRWFKANTTIPFQVVLRQGGELQAEFEAIAPTFLFDPGWPPPSRLTRLWQRLRPPRDSRLQRLLNHCRQANIGLIYANTLITSDLVVALQELACPVLCHVHELDFLIRHYLGLAEFARLQAVVPHYIAVSEAVRTNLSTQHQIPATQIDRIYGFIPTTAQPVEPDQYQAVRQELGVPPEAALVCGSGTLEWRKGPDLFLQLAQQVRQRQPQRPIYFLWVGGDLTSPTAHQLIYDLKQAGLDDRVRFLGAQAQPARYFAACDLFALMSREDPFPLVCLEAAALGKPLLCFAGGGGMPELVETDSGFVVPYLDLDQMAERVLTLVADPALGQRLGQRAAQKVRERHDLAIAAPQILQVIQRYLQD